MNRFIPVGIILNTLLLTSPIAQAASRIVILGFELNDITSLPNTSRERRRTAEIEPPPTRASVIRFVLMIWPPSWVRASTRIG